MKTLDTQEANLKEIAENLISLSARNFKPMAYNLGYSGRRGYVGTGGGIGSGGEAWPYGLSGDGVGFSYDHRRTRQNGRRAFHDSFVARSVVERYKDTVAGVGLKFISEINHKILGISQERAEAIGEDISERFDLWAGSPSCYRSRVMNFYQAQGLYALCQQRDNDIFTRFYYSDDPSLMSPFQFAFIDPEQIIGDAFTSTFDHGWLNDGIERDTSGRETAYRVRVKNKGEYKNVTIPAYGKSGRRMMLHGFYPEYAGQGRGYSRLVSGLQGFQTLQDFTYSHIVKAIQQASFWMFNQPSGDADASDPFQDLARTPAGPPSAQFGSAPQPAEGAENVTEESLEPFKYHPLPETVFTTPGSHVITNLRRGEKIVPFASTAPADQYDKFVDSFTAYLSAASGIPVEVLLMRFNENYSASRAALIMFYRISLIWRNEMNVDFCGPILETWISEDIAAGRLSLPGWSDPIMRTAWMNGKWRGFPIPNIDPDRMSRANERNAKMAAITLDDVAWETSQSSGKSNRAKLKKELAELTGWPADKKGE